MPSAVSNAFKSVLTNDWHSGQKASPTKATFTLLPPPPLPVRRQPKEEPIEEPGGRGDHSKED